MTPIAKRKYLIVSILAVLLFFGAVFAVRDLMLATQRTSCTTCTSNAFELVLSVVMLGSFGVSMLYYSTKYLSEDWEKLGWRNVAVTLILGYGLGFAAIYGILPLIKDYFWPVFGPPAVQ